MAVTIEELLAREDISQCLLRHFRAADRLDLAAEAEAFWPDGRFVGGPVEGPASSFMGSLFDTLRSSFESVMHYIANMAITVTGDCGRAELYGIGWHLLADDAAVVAGVIGEQKFAEFGRNASKRYELWVGVRYAVEMQRRGQEWRILTMQPIIEWTRVQHYNGIAAGGLPAAMPTVPRRDRSDASYFAQEWNP